MAGHIMLAGIHRSLKDADTPWNDKLKLARFAWCSSQCFLPNKQQVLLDWVCNALANQTKFDIEDETVCTLWQYLHDILNSKQMTKTIESSTSMSIRDALYPVLCDALRVDSEYVAMATACCHIILQSSSLGRSLTGKHDVMIDLLCALLHLVTKCLETSNSLQDTAVPCLKMLLKKFSLSHRQRQLQAHRKAFTAAYERLLIPALALYTCEEVGDKSTLKGQIEDLILMGIFNKDMSEVYRLYLTINRDSLEGRDKLKEGQFTDIDNFIEFLQKEAQHCKEKDSRINPVLAGLPVLYRTFITAYKPTADAKFAMLKKLCGIMGISPAAKDSRIASSPPPSCDWEQALPALELVLKDVYINDIYVVSVDNSEGQPKFQWFLQLLQLLLTSADKPSASLFNCLHTFLDLNHMLIEEELTQIWNVSLMIHPSSSLRADNFEESRTAFLGSLMQTYVKLRQFDKLLECLLASFNQEEPSTDNTGDNLVYFNPGFVHRFSQCIQELPPGLTLDLWKLFKVDLVNSYISRISDATNLEPPKKKKRRSAASIGKNVEMGLEQAAVTFHLFLTSARVIDLSATKVMMDRTESLVAETQEEVLQALHTLCQNATEEVNERILFATLLLTYTMGEIQLILLQHTKYGSKHSKYVSDNAEEQNPATQSAVDILGRGPCIGDFLNLKSGEEVMDIIGGYVKVLGSDHHRLRHLVHLLRTQQLRAVLLHSSSNDGTKDDGVMKAYSEDVLGSIDVEVDSDVLGATWDGQVASISHENYPIAFLHVLTQTFSIWLPHITTQHSNQVVRLLVQSFSSDTPQQDGNLTMSSIARAFLCSDVCMESKELQTELLSAAFRCISNSAGSFSPKKSSKGQRSSSGIIMQYGKLLSMLTEVTDIQDTNWEVLEAVGSEFSTLLKDNTSAQGSSKKVKGAVKNILNILNVLDQLPLTHMLPTNQDRCMLGLVVIDAMVTGWLATGDVACQPQLIEALCFCRNLEMNILKAMKSTGILKCFEVSSMLAYIINKHMHAWECVQETNQTDSLSGRFLVLDDVTQMLMRQWMQKAAHRASQEENILMDVIKLIEDKISALIAKLKSSRPSARLNHLHGAIPLLTTVATIIQRTASPQTQDSKNRTYNEAVKKLCSWLQELLTSVEVDAAEEVDVLLVGCLAKSAVAVVMCQKAGRGDGVQTVSDQDASVVAMEEDDSSPALATKKSKKKRTVESVAETDDASLWNEVLEPILHLALTHIGRMKGVEPSDPKAKRKEGQQVGEAAILSTCLDYVRTVCDFVGDHRGKIDGGIMGKMWTRVSVAMSMEEDGQSKAEILRAASSILTCMDVDLFSKTLEETLQILSLTELSPVSVASLQSCVLSWQVLPDCQLSEEKHKFLQENIPKAITSLHCLLVESVRDWSMTGVLALNILTTINSVMTSSKKLLEPKQALQTLQACLAVQFTSVPDDYFPAVFSTMYLLLKSLLEAFPQAVVHCMAAYMASLQHMLRGVMRRCHQGSEGAGRIGDQELFSCAENMERLLTQLSAHKKEVGKFVIVLVAEYINELQKGTLLPFVKRALVVGVYNLVDVCDEKDVSLLQATLPHNVKEIYTEFYSDYKKYHKYKGRV